MAFRRPGPTPTAATLSILSVLAFTLAACGNSGSGASSSTADQPVNGGTLRLLGSSDVDHLDTASAYYTTSYTLERAFTRQLFSYPASTDITKANTPVADLASEVPTKDNGGISADGKTYTIHLRSGVKWNTTPARDVTAQDEILGLKRLCNPVSPVGAPGYYENTIVGMKAYCDGFAKVPGTASAIAAYINGHDISGVKATDAQTLTFTLLQPASDFVNILAMPFASPVPREYLSYVPDNATFRLDATVQAQILDLLMNLQTELGTALIIITHDLGVVAQMADEVLVMYAGRVVETADRRAAYYRTHHPDTLGLLASVPSTVGSGRLRPVPGQPPSPILLPSGCAFHPRCQYAMPPTTAGPMWSMSTSGTSATSWTARSAVRRSKPSVAPDTAFGPTEARCVAASGFQRPPPRATRLSTRSVRVPVPSPNSTRVPSPPMLR
jgi:oligopeptide/dipeptide ABC transporter ATP-binding protein